MRLFIAINFDNNTKEYLKEAQTQLKGISNGGNFSLVENLHLTVVFLGEIEPSNVGKIKEAMNAVDIPKFELSVSGIGRFKRDRGDIIWVGVNKSRLLSSLYNSLYRQLISNGFEIQNRDYNPHITLARNVVITGDLGVSPALIKTKVERISLMKSDFIEGKLTYTEIYGVKLV